MNAVDRAWRLFGSIFAQFMDASADRFMRVLTVLLPGAILNFYRLVNAVTSAAVAWILLIIGITAYAAIVDPYVKCAIEHQGVVNTCRNTYNAGGGNGSAEVYCDKEHPSSCYKKLAINFVSGDIGFLDFISKGLSTTVADKIHKTAIVVFEALIITPWIYLGYLIVFCFVLIWFKPYVLKLYGGGGESATITAMLAESRKESAVMLAESRKETAAMIAESRKTDAATTALLGELRKKAPAQGPPPAPAAAAEEEEGEHLPAPISRMTDKFRTMFGPAITAGTKIPSSTHAVYT